MPPLKHARYEAFCRAYRSHGIAYQAVIDAGFKSKGKKDGSSAANAQATRLMKRPEIRARIAELQEHTRRRQEISKERWLRELASIGFSDVREFVDEIGNPVDIQALSDNAAAAVASVEITEESGRSYSSPKIKTKKYRLVDKLPALGMLGKHLGFLTEKHEHSGPEGGPIKIEDVKSELYAKLARHAASGPDAVPGQPDAAGSAGPEIRVAPVGASEPAPSAE